MAGLGMVRIKRGLCRTRRGRFVKCRKPIHKGRGKGYSRRHTRGTKGKCIRWSKGKTRCIKRARYGMGYKKRPAGTKPRRSSSRFIHHPGGYVTMGGKGKGRCLKWSKGRTRCLKRA